MIKMIPFTMDCMMELMFIRFIMFVMRPTTTTPIRVPRVGVFGAAVIAVLCRKQVSSKLGLKQYIVYRDN